MDTYYPGAVPRVASFVRNGTLDFPGFRRALLRACELAQGRLSLAPAVARVTGGWPLLEPFAEEATRYHLAEVIAGSLEQAAREATALAGIHPGAAKDLRAAHQLVTAQLESIENDQRSIVPPLSPVADLLRRYAVAHARWLSARAVQGAEGNAADAQQQLAALRAEVRLAEQTLAAALTAIQAQGSPDALFRAEQDAWVAALGAAVPRSLG